MAASIRIHTMATSVPNRTISLAVSPPAATATPPRASPASLAPSHPHRNPNRSKLHSSHVASRTAPVASRRLGAPRAVSDSEVIQEEDGSLSQNNSGIHMHGALRMQDLIQSYKEAIIKGDEQGISVLESSIHMVENEKVELLKKVTEIAEEIASGKEKILRLSADFENFRKRTDKDRQSFTSDIQTEVIESLLPLVDNFETAKQQTVPETEKEKKIATSYQGIYKQFVETMRALRVSVVETVGKQFDPLVHEAVERVDSHQFRAGTVLQEVQRGFLLGDRILRPAKVKVSNGPSSKNVATVGQNSAEQNEEATKSNDEEITVA